MSVSGVGIRSQLAVQSLVDMRRQLDDLQRQLGTGKMADTYAGQGLDRGLALALRSQLSALASYDDAVTTVGVRLDLAQLALARMGEIGRNVKSAALQSPEIKATGQAAVQEAARSQLDELLQLLNTRMGDRYLFSGRSADRAAVETAAHILDGEGVRAGLRQIVAERAAADLGANGLGRLAIPAAAGTTVSVAEDIGGSPFGLKLAGVNSNLSGATVIGPAGSPANVSVQIGATNPNPGETIAFTFSLPDGTTQTITLEATASAPPGAGKFTIGATPAATAANLQAALTSAVDELAHTSLLAASAIAASEDFFNIAVGDPPLRVAGPPFDIATALVAGTSADTVLWYTGEIASDPPRSSAVARVDQTIAVNYGLRANEEGIRRLVQNVAAFAAVSFTPTDAAGPARYAALSQRVAASLAFADGTQKIEDIAGELAGSQRTLKAAQERHQQTRGTVEGLLDTIEGIPTEQVAAEILALQTRLQASLQTTSMLYRISLVNYL
jgi:flagellar hook-associated protein 3 FlgL